MAASQNRVWNFLRFVINGGPSTDGVPARVIAEIDRREATAERVIGLVQLAIVIAFISLYAFSPRAEGTSGYNYAPLVLTAYFVITMGRVLLSYLMTLPWWILIISIVLDVMLLCGLIFSFHLQYDQPAAFSLKAPTMVYLFLFIAVRAMRFDPRYVLATGMTAVAGWSLMIFVALNSDMGEMHITRNYVDYLTSNSILIGAEIDKILALAGVTFVLSLALYRARFVLFSAAQSASAAADLTRFFAPEVARSITSSDDLPDAGRSQTREAAVLFVDVRGFTDAAEGLSPETVMAVLSLYQKIAMAEIQSAGGRIDKFMGDGILATFGAVDANPSYAAAALHAASAVVTAMDARQAEFAALGWPGSFRIGAAVAAGAVTVGVIGAYGRLEFTVIGNPVNLAAKMENANKQQKTRALTNLETFRIAQAQGFDAPLNARPAEMIEGVAHSVDLVVVT